MNEIPFSLRVILGTVTLSKEEFAMLERGDLLFLDQKVSEPLRVELGGGVEVLAYAGVKEGFKAIKIEEV